MAGLENPKIPVREENFTRDKSTRDEFERLKFYWSNKILRALRRHEVARAGRGVINDFLSLDRHSCRVCFVIKDGVRLSFSKYSRDAMKIARCKPSSGAS
jgi:hypothetical protein